MKILFTAEFIDLRTGAELYVVELARAMHARGHEVWVHARRLGPLAEELRAAGIPIDSDMQRLHARPDVIHAQHFLPAMLAVMHFRDVPAVFVSHSSDMWIDDTPLFSLHRFVGVSRVCMARLRREGAAADKICFVPNWVDVQRFRMRGPLPERPRRALVFSNRATESNFLAILREACNAAGIELDVAGLRMRSLATKPEDLLPHYDLVFAKARAAMEALSAGAAVVLCDEAGLGPLVTEDRLESLLEMNCGYESLTDPHTAQGVLHRIARYSADDAHRVCMRIRTLRADHVIFDQWESLLDEVSRAARRRAASGEVAAAAIRTAWRWPRWKGAELYWQVFGRFTQWSQSPMLRALMRSVMRGT